MFPFPEGENPVRLAEEGDAVQLKVVPVIEEVSRILVVCPEQIVSVVELMITSGRGVTLTVSF